MNLYDYFQTIDLQAIKRFVEEGEIESLNLEFKTVNHPANNDIARNSDKKNYSKTISGFANSSGGIIIWGVDAKENKNNQDVAKGLKPIQELTSFLNFLNRNEGLAVIPKIDGVRHEKIEYGKDEGFIKTFVPPSETGPHMALLSDKHYYKRSGDSFYQCEHFDIADMFSRKSSPKLKVTAKALPPTKHGHQIRIMVLISIENYGLGIAKFPALALNTAPKFQAHEYGLDGNSNTGLIKVKNNLKYQSNYNGGNDVVIYPKSKLDIDIYYQLQNEQHCRDLVIEYIVFAENMANQEGTITVKGEEFEALWSQLSK